jgi:RNA polymerase sigma factor (sigma-70 family)
VRTPLAVWHRDQPDRLASPARAPVPARDRPQRTIWSPARESGHEERLIDRVSAAPARPTLTAALMALPRDDRDVLLLIALADMDYAEVAEALAIPYGTVCSRLNRVRRTLRESLGGVNPIGSPESAANA